MFLKNKNKEIKVFAPVSGEIRLLEKVKDEVFSKKMMGEGISIVHKDSKVFSPVEKGNLKAVFPTNHAFGFSTFKKGPEILVHIGIDTVNLEGKGFSTNIKQNDAAELSTEICSLDLKVIDKLILEKKASSSEIIVLALNESIQNYDVEIIAKEGTKVKKGDLIFKLNKK